MSSIIVAAPPVYGESVPLLQLATALEQRGHHVTALVGGAFTDIAATASRVVVLPGPADAADLLRNPERVELEPGPAQLNWDHTNVFVGGLIGQHEALQQLLAEDPNAVLLCNSLFFGAWPVAMGVPGRRPRRWVAVAANPVIVGDDATTPFGPIPGLAGDALVAANRDANEQFEAMFHPSRQSAQNAVDKLGATEVLPPYVTSVYTLPDAMMALTVPEFDFPRTNAPHTLHYGGILPMHSAEGSPIPSWWSELGRERPVVVVTQGTAANHDFGDLVEPTLDALAGQDVLVIAVLGRNPAVLGVEPPANARVEQYVPFDVLLPHADLLITNGGFGGTQHALERGVPVIVAGATEDKPMVAAHVAFHRVGLNLQTQRPTSTQIADAVSTVLGDPSYLQAA